jgi:hypothetical protein
MALPVASTAKYELTLPSQQKTISYRPFLVKEEKVLLMAMESGDAKEMLSAIKEIVKSCTFGEMIAEDYPMFDIEYVFLQIRSKSVGEKTKLKVLCPDDGKTYAETEIDLSKIEVYVDDDHTPNIMLDESRKLGVVFNYPTLENSQVGMTLDAKNLDSAFKVIVDCIDHIYEGDKTYPAKDSTKQELKDFIENLSQEAFKKIRKFFDTMPQLRHEIEVENPKTKVKNKITFKGIQDFFQ